MNARTEDKQHPPLPFTLSKKNVEVCFSYDPDDNFMISIQIFRHAALIRTHTIIRPDLDQWMNLYIDDGYQKLGHE
jgi:hypothetical protein